MPSYWRDHALGFEGAENLASADVERAAALEAAVQQIVAATAQGDALTASQQAAAQQATTLSGAITKAQLDFAGLTATTDVQRLSVSLLGTTYDNLTQAQQAQIDTLAQYLARNQQVTDGQQAQQAAMEQARQSAQAYGQALADVQKQAMQVSARNPFEAWKASQMQFDPGMNGGQGGLGSPISDDQLKRLYNQQQNVQVLTQGISGFSAAAWSGVTAALSPDTSSLTELNSQMDALKIKRTQLQSEAFVNRELPNNPYVAQLKDINSQIDQTQSKIHGMGNSLGSALHRVFQTMYQDFAQTLQKIAADYLKSQFVQMINHSLGGLFGLNKAAASAGSSVPPAASPSGAGFLGGAALSLPGLSAAAAPTGAFQDVRIVAALTPVPVTMGVGADAGAGGALGSSAKNVAQTLQQASGSARQATDAFKQMALNAATASAALWGISNIGQKQGKHKTGAIIGSILGTIGGEILGSAIGLTPQQGAQAGLGIGSWIGGQFAQGGRPPLKKPSLVGERGPELFVPDGPGTVVPNDKLGDLAGDTYTTHVHINLPPGTDVPAFRRAQSVIMAEAKMHAERQWAKNR